MIPRSPRTPIGSSRSVTDGWSPTKPAWARMSSWAIRQAARELRGAGRHFGYLVACVTLGVAALVAVGTLARSLERTVAKPGKTLMGADPEIASSQALRAGSASAPAALTPSGALP